MGIQLIRSSGLLLWSTFAVACFQGSSVPGPVNGQNAVHHVERIVQFGPHPPGSQAQRNVGDYLIEVLESFDLEVKTDTFSTSTPEGRIEMRNIWGVLSGARSDTILLASHYDSKLFKEFEFVGANDGGSSSGLILELARVLKQNNPSEYSYWFVFFDGEEAFRNWTSLDSLYGSRRFVKTMAGRGGLEQIKAMILLDLIGGQDLAVERDLNSDPWLNNIVWETARELGADQIFREFGTTSAVDDHLPFRERGIPVIDLIDLEYAYWHRPGDTLDKLSPENIEIVGNVVYASLPKITVHLDRQQEIR
jgi:Zn-dependent M28 family amino/carboxypeptidase